MAPGAARPAADWIHLFPVPVALLCINESAEAVIADANAAFWQLTGFTAQALVFHSLLSSSTENATWKDAVAACQAGLTPQTVDTVLWRNVNSPAATEEAASIDVEITLRLLASGKPTWVVATIMNRSAERALVHKLTQTRSRFATALALTGAALLTVNDRMLISEATPAAGELLGQAELIGAHLSEVMTFVHTATGQAATNPVLHALLTGSAPLEREDLALAAPRSTVPQALRHIRLRIAVTAAANGVGPQAIVAIQTTPQPTVPQLWIPPTTDLLTGLPLLAAYTERLQQAFALAQRHRTCFGVLQLQLHGLQTCRLSHGHAAADQWVCAFAQAVKNCLRRSDSLCRIADDAFAVVLPALSQEADIATLCAKVGPLLAQQVPLQVQMGWATYPAMGNDAAMWQAHLHTAA